jgi:hypothetical protein
VTHARSVLDPRGGSGTARNPPPKPSRTRKSSDVDKYASEILPPDGQTRKKSIDEGVDEGARHFTKILETHWGAFSFVGLPVAKNFGNFHRTFLGKP